jgi:hypothetical protein
MKDVAKEQEPEEGQESEEVLPPLPPYSPDPRLIDLMERGAQMTDEEARQALARDAGGS